jgi:hypothetical protein
MGKTGDDAMGWVSSGELLRPCLETFDSQTELSRVLLTWIGERVQVDVVYDLDMMAKEVYDAVYAMRESQRCQDEADDALLSEMLLLEVMMECEEVRCSGFDSYSSDRASSPS